MNCKRSSELIVPYVEGELAPAEAAELGAHLRGCADCRRSSEEQRVLGEALKTQATRFVAPDALRLRLVAALEEAQAIEAPASASAAVVPMRRPAMPWRPLAMAASLVLAVVMSSGLTAYLTLPGQQEDIVQEVVTGHIRSLMAEHLTDVASSDQHTVKPWFHGKLDISPPVDDLKAEGFPLVGGRLDYLDQRPVAALVYRHRQHPINVFVMPADTGAATTGTESFAQRGFNVLHWMEDGMSLWAVSDLNLAELHDFEKLFEQRTVGGDGS
ncbi:MAG: anti-sigma factor [Alphaproteobacteria bacterium]|nr:anti-sigma factor [Alphaproteobacteria bacterium]